MPCARKSNFATFSFRSSERERERERERRERERWVGPREDDGAWDDGGACEEDRAYEGGGACEEVPTPPIPFGG
jgi:hypothetical protein